jgi:hypothetical protein
MAWFDLEQHCLVGSGGSLLVPDDDEITRKLSMLIEGECEGLGPTRAAQKFLAERGALGLQSRKRGPKTNYRRTDEVIRQVIRHRFLDPEASPEVIGQKLRQSGFPIATRSVERVIEQFGLQKKTPSLSPHL